ncbi:TlpA family protein disulfide reductase [Polyangium spumosum]|uniref:Redoxin domain-containing protein n=1 Tax=Polyangium spumosum TaxID=889282 RepID=A0A6N7PX03_9BACT|nr:TlpA disulfide reductase family protein [Polyangium spumosum]MRG94614.1 redoxin domain-containing protein [Polyangium spumosum]
MRGCLHFSLFAPRVFACVGAIGLLGCAPALPASMGHPLLGAASPPFHETAIDERSVDVPGTLRTHVTVIDFWASWCGSCQQTMPALEALYQDRRAEGLVVVGVSVDDHEEDAARGAEAFGVSFPIVYDFGHRLQYAFDVSSVPITFVVDRSGTVRFVGRDPSSIRRAVIALMDR